MNLLAHAYLSFNDADLLAGNMISDFVKGKRQYDYSSRILAGIKLHRAIDEFTDTHPATAAIKSLFRPAYRLYSGAMADVAYDHFLANDTAEFSSHFALKDFTERTYRLLETRADSFPAPFAAMFPHMRGHNWLYHYRTDEGMRKSFGGVQRRAKYIAESETAFQIFLENKPEIGTCYAQFFPDVKSFAAHTSRQLLTA